MKFFLIVSKGKRRGFPVPIEVDLFMIGQAPMCQMRAHHDDIGEEHCAIAIRGKKVFIRDLGSGHATLVNGDVMPSSEEWPLHAGDRLGIGPLEFVVQYREHLGSRKDIEDWALKQLDEDTGPKKSALDELREIENAQVDRHDSSAVAGNIIDRLSAQKGVVRGRLRIANQDGVTVVRINETFLVDEAELAHLKKELHDNLSQTNLRVLLDFKSVRRMSTAATRMLSDIVSWLRRSGSTLAMCRLKPELLGMVQELSEVYHFKIFPDKDQAVEARW